MTIEILDPTYEAPNQRIAYAQRPTSLQGMRIGLVDNTKVNSDRLLLRIAGILESEHGAQAHVLRRKKSPSVPAHAELVAEMRGQCDVVLAGIGD